jgi:hypothetical protein
MEWTPASCGILGLVSAGLLRDARTIVSGKEYCARPDPAREFLSSLCRKAHSPIACYRRCRCHALLLRREDDRHLWPDDNTFARTSRHDVLSMNPDLTALISRNREFFAPHFEWERPLYESSAKNMSDPASLINWVRIGLRFGFRRI